MGAFNQASEVCFIAVFRVDALVVFDGVIAAQNAFPLCHPNGLNRHKPEGVDPHFCQPRQVGFKGSKRPFRAVLADIHFIDIGLTRPCGVIHCRALVRIVVCIIGGGLAGEKQAGCNK